jgi:NAD(P)-dependent dehydrogenase (short-subunit alcohol dehydrogenase family)
MGFIQAPISPNPPMDLSGKTVIVTGGNAGLGAECVRQFVAAKASRVVLACRTPSKGEVIRKSVLEDPEIQKISPTVEIPVMKLDLETYASVMEFSKGIKKGQPKLHILLLNAGIGRTSYEQSPTGHEEVLQVNYLSNVLLALELLPLLQSTSKAEGSPTKLSWVASRAHKSTTLALQPGEGVIGHFDNKSNFSALKNYGDTKLLAVMFLSELAKRIPKEQVLINSMCPAMVKTNMGDVLPIYFRVPLSIVQAMRARTVEQGAWVLVYAATLAGSESHGRFLLDKEVDP